MSSKFAGLVAAEVSNRNGYTRLDPYIEIDLDPMLPLPGSKEEMLWLKELRRQWTKTKRFSSPEELGAILRAENFKYRVCKLDASLCFNESENGDAFDLVGAKSMEELLLYLEGLDWF